MSMSVSVQRWCADRTSLSLAAHRMKLYFVPLAIVIICVVLTFSLLVLHNSPKYQDEHHGKYQPQKRFPFQTGDQQLTNTDISPYMEKGSVERESVVKRPDIDVPTSPPIPTDGLEGAIGESSVVPRNDSWPKPLSVDLDRSIAENLHAAELEARVPANLAINETVLNSLKILSGPSIDHNTLPIATPDVAIPVQEKSVAATVVIPPYRSTISVEDSMSGDDVFAALRALHPAALRNAVHSARENAELILPDTSAFSVDKSLSEIAEGSFEFHTLSRLHRALRTGSLCRPPSKAVSESNEYLAMQSLFDTKGDKETSFAAQYMPKAVIEYVPSSSDPASTVAFTLAAAQPTVTVLLLTLPPTPSIEAAAALEARYRRSSALDTSEGNLCSAERAGSNVYVADGRGNALDRSELRLDCAQIIPSLDLLVGNLLPFEFEEMLANVFCRCNATFIPQTLPETAFFAFWDSATHLLSSVEKLASGSCVLRYDMNSVSSKLTSPVRNSHIVVQRNESAVTVAESASSTSSGGSSGSSGTSTSSSSTYSGAFSSSSRTSYASVWSSSSSSSKTHETSPTGNSEETKRVAAALSKRYLSVGQLSALHLDTRSRHHLWSSVLFYFGARDGGEIYANASSAAALLVRGASVLSATDLAQPRKSARPQMALGDDTTGTSSQSSSDAKASAAAPSTSTAIATEPAVDLMTGHRSAMSAAEAPPAQVAVPAGAVSAASDNSTSSTLSSRRRLYILTKSSDSSTTPVTTSSRRSGSSTLVNTLDYLPEEDVELAWDLPEPIEADEVDRAIEAELFALSQSEKEAGPDAFTRDNRGGSFVSKRYSISGSSRDLQRHLHLRETDSYRRWMRALRAVPTDTSGVASSAIDVASSAGLVYLMGRHISLLSLKLAKLLKARHSEHGAVAGASAGILVSLLSDSLSFRSHALLTTMMGLGNNLVCRPAWNPTTAAGLLATPERASLSVVQVDVLVELLVNSLTIAESGAASGSDCQVDVLEEGLASLLSMSMVTVIELPSTELLRAVLAASGASSVCVDTLSTRYGESPARLLELAVRRLKVGVSAVIAEVASTDAPLDALKIFRVDLTFADSSAGGDAGTVGKFITKPTDAGVSLYTALQLGVIDAQKKTLLKMLIDFPLWKFPPTAEIFPWELFLRLVGGGSDAGASTWALYYNGAGDGSGATVSGGIDAPSRNHAVYAAGLRSAGAAHHDGRSIGVSQRGNSALSDRIQGRAVWRAIENELNSHSAELAEGCFSFVEHDSGFGYVSLRVAKSFPNATVISIERNAAKVAHHVAVANSLSALNNAVCRKTESDSVIYRNIYESPELFRFQLLSRSMLDGFIAAESQSDWGIMIGTMLSTALTSFVYAPHSAQVSWAMHVLFSEVYEFESSVPASRSVGSTTGGSRFRRFSLSAPIRPLSDVFGGTTASDHSVQEVLLLNSPSHHPQFPYRDFEKQWVLKHARVNGGNTAIQLSPLAARDQLSDTSKDKVVDAFSLPLVRCDIVNMTRHVHHHYDYSKDGHTRTYTMRVRVSQNLSDVVMSHIGDPSHALARHTPDGIVLNTVNHNSLFSGERTAAAESGDGVLLPLGYHPDQHSVVGVHLFRDRDTFPIPYTNIYGVTLISALRLGLEESQRDRLFKDFLKMPLYEDMAPWNVVLMGQSVDYIDYDTRDITFNKVIPQAYQVMTVLMNYKRTVEDFKRCGSKSPTVYGLPYVSDCVGSNVDRSMSCPDLKLPVPCADGNCHSDYISCLRAITSQAEEIAQQQQQQQEGLHSALAEQVHGHTIALVNSNIVAAMKSVVGQFNDHAASAKSYEEFFRNM